MLVSGRDGKISRREKRALCLATAYDRERSRKRILISYLLLGLLNANGFLT
jgi:hypothetical protein